MVGAGYTSGWGDMLRGLGAVLVGASSSSRDSDDVFFPPGNVVRCSRSHEGVGGKDNGSVGAGRGLGGSAQ